MKLLFCTACGDVAALRREQRTCTCGRSAGRYVDPLHAEILGPSLVLAFLNREFFGVLAEQLSLGDLDEKLTSPPYAGHTKGRGFTAIIVPEDSPSVTRLDGGPYPWPTRAEAGPGRRVQSLASLRDEMKAVARGERPAPADASKPSINSRDVLIVCELPDDVVAAIEAAEYGKVLDHLERGMIVNIEKVGPLDPAPDKSSRSSAARTDVDPEAPIEPDGRAETKG